MREELLDQLLGDVRTMVECESPSSDLAAVARSADVVSRIGADRLGSAPERIEIDGRTHLRWRIGSQPESAPVSRWSETSGGGAAGAGGASFALSSASAWPARSAKTSPSSSEFEASRLAPCTPVEATSPTAQSPRRVERPSRSVRTPPMA